MRLLEWWRGGCAGRAPPAVASLPRPPRYAKGTLLWSLLRVRCGHTPLAALAPLSFRKGRLAPFVLRTFPPRAGANVRQRRFGR